MLTQVKQGVEQQKIKPNIQVIILGKQYQIQATIALNQGILKQNPIWKHYAKGPAQTYQYVNQIVKRSRQLNLLYGVVDQDSKELISVIAYFDIVDYLPLMKHIQQKYKNVRLVSQNSGYGGQLQKQLGNQVHQRGNMIYGFLGASVPKYYNSEYVQLLTSVALINFIQKGYKHILVRVTNEYAKRSMLKSGKILKQLDIPQLSLKLYLFKVQITSFQKFSEESLFQFWESVNFKPKL